MLLVPLVVGGCIADRERSHEYWEKQLTETPPASISPEEVSLIRLIANPRDYNGHYVRVFGYLHMEFERDAVFVGKVDCEQWLEPNSLSIGICRKEISEKLRSLSDQYVFLEGKFYLSSLGSSTLWNITRAQSTRVQITNLSLSNDTYKQPNPGSAANDHNRHAPGGAGSAPVAGVAHP
jgi:hypothetical protein